MNTQTDYIFINHNGLSEKEIKSLILKKDKGIMKIISTAIAERKKEIERDLNNFQRTKAEAKEGNADVKYNLAFMYDYGIGTAEDKVEASKWYSLSAKEGNAEAQEMLNIINPKVNSTNE